MNTKFDEAQKLAERFKSVKNRSEFARTFEVPGGSSMIYQHIHGLRPISPEAAKAYARGFNCSIEEISPSVAETLKVSPDISIRKDHSRAAGDAGKRDIAYFHLIPIRGSAKLGESDNWFVDLQYPVGHGDGYIKFPSTDKDAYAVRCEGDSMSPRIRHGEFAIIEPNREVNPGDEVLVQSKDEQVMVKVFSHQREGRAYFESINDGTHKPFSLSLEEIESMQYVAGVAKSALKVEDI